MANARHIGIQGHVSRGFEAVRDAFVDNFSRRRELGAACCVYRHGEKVVDLWGGVRNKASGEPWQEDTMVIVHSTTKGLAAMTLRSRIPGAGSITRNACAPTGQSLPSAAKSSPERRTVTEGTRREAFRLDGLVIGLNRLVSEGAGNCKIRSIGRFRLWPRGHPNNPSERYPRI
jgi:hypothetical protein